jgi:hypothetical protein
MLLSLPVLDRRETRAASQRKRERSYFARAFLDAARANRGADR